MLILKDNKLQWIDVSEDASDKETGIYAIKTVDILLKEQEELNKNSFMKSTITYSKDKISKLAYSHKFGGWIFTVTQSEFSDDSGLGSGNGIHETKGVAISAQLKSGYKVFNGNIEITK